MLSLSLPPDQRLPHVLIQLPVFNEPHVAQRVIEAAGALDWPSDKLHIQLLDDSTDETTAIACQAIAGLRARGIEVTHLQRAERTDYKAGALREGLRAAPREYIAIFDADFVPASNFLRLCLLPLLADPRLAFVQARWEWLNAERNALTRAQRIVLDGHFAVEQTAKTWSGYITHFSGSGGVWRRAAIEDTGGWSADTLCEDVDLSYHAQIRGWRALFLLGVTVPSELPDSLETWRIQQARWAKGFGQVMRKHGVRLWRSELTMSQKLVASANFMVGALGPVFYVALVAGVIDFLVGPGPTPTTACLAILAILEAGGAAIAMMALGQRMVRGAGLARSLPGIVAALCFFAYAQIRAASGVLEGLGGKAAAFVRTPKKGTFPAPRGNVPEAAPGRD